MSKKSGFKELEFSRTFTQSSNSLSNCKGWYIGRVYIVKPWEIQHIILGLWGHFLKAEMWSPIPVDSSFPACLTLELLFRSALQISQIYKLITDASQISIDENFASARTARLQSPWLSTGIVYHPGEPRRIKEEKLIKKFYLKLITEIIKFTEINPIRYFLWFFPQSKYTMA